MPFVDNRGVRIHYETYGSGPPIVLLHGSMMDARSWALAGYPEHLGDAYTLIAIDGRGAGDSDKPREPSSYALDLCASDVLAVADDLGHDRFALWGFSWGGAIAWRVAESHADRVDALIVLGCFTRKHLVDRDFVEEHRVKRILEVGGGGFFDIEEPEEGPLPEWFRDQFVDTDPEAYVAMRRGAYDWPPLDATCVDVPTLLLHGTLEDRKARSLDVAASMPDGRGHMLEGFSHCRAFVAAEVTAPLVRDFLEGLG